MLYAYVTGVRLPISLDHRILVVRCACPAWLSVQLVHAQLGCPFSLYMSSLVVHSACTCPARLSIQLVLVRYGCPCVLSQSGSLVCYACPCRALTSIYFYCSSDLVMPGPLHRLETSATSLFVSPPANLQYIPLSLRSPLPPASFDVRRYLCTLFLP